MDSIEQVILRMDDIVDQCKRDHLRAGYFAVLYRFVTIRIKQCIENGDFDDSARMERLDAIFAQRFFDAFDGHYNNRGEPVTESWKHAFNSAESGDYVIMQHLFLGINAHINLDLGIAAAETMQGQNMDEIWNDYDKVNGILSSLVEQVKSNIGRVSLLFGPMIRLANGRDEMLIDFSILTARDGAWLFACRYAKASDKNLEIQNRDRVIAALARKLTNTGKTLTFLIGIIRWGEFRTLPSELDRLAGILD
ncbi:hypothetical protein DYD21_08505 [Rhodohalobacter sp. SW132]|uniref:DUF5995 family protein n=1 Tax=Rhodohalobacter sp. SW132 TaxID=2293433 RepID=UPI000E22283B|nr:DUF5995 family protein [Rhodohalobacter sp. SW132]REL37929.1 hypothetical protein DYD21_08505 [Rhodohalobacter sp. SW132]